VGQKDVFGGSGWEKRKAVSQLNVCTGLDNFAMAAILMHRASSAMVRQPLAVSRQLSAIETAAGIGHRTTVCSASRPPRGVFRLHVTIDSRPEVIGKP
jgi:hypothetical protein